MAERSGHFLGHAGGLQVVTHVGLHQDGLAHVGRQRDERAISRRVLACDEAPIDGLLPHGQARARRPPGVEHLGVGAGIGTDPLEEVEDQRVDGIGLNRACGLAHGVNIGRGCEPATDVKARSGREA